MASIIADFSLGIAYFFNKMSTMQEKKKRLESRFSYKV